MAPEFEQIIISIPREFRRIAVYLWKPKEEVRGIVQIVHGMREHMGRYRELAHFLCGYGFAVCGHDHMSHGKSRLPDAAFGYFGETDGPQTLVRDCRRVTRLIQQLAPSLPVFLLGHSMGSFIGKLCVLHNPLVYGGFVCTGTGGENSNAPTARALAEFLVRTQGSKQEGRLLDKLTFSGYNRHFRGEDSPSAWLSRDPAIVRGYDTDPLIGRYFTNSGFRDLYDIQMAATRNQWAKRVDKTLPILLMAGSDDPVGNYGQGVLEVYNRLQQAGVRDVELHLYEGARHEVLNETNRADVYADLLLWLKKHLQPQ